MSNSSANSDESTDTPPAHEDRQIRSDTAPDQENEEPHFELSWNGEGVSITEYDISSDHAQVENEWWWTWAELFTELTGIDDYAPDIV